MKKKYISPNLKLLYINCSLMSVSNVSDEEVGEEDVLSKSYQGGANSLLWEED